jgi:hypothetical protein
MLIEATRTKDQTTEDEVAKSARAFQLLICVSRSSTQHRDLEPGRSQSYGDLTCNTPERRLRVQKNSQ